MNGSFVRTLCAEWIKLRTVRGWLAGLLLVPGLTILLGVVTANGSVCGVGPGPGLPKQLACTAPAGPGGQLVQDQFYFVHRPLAADGSITARVTSLTGPDLQPWAKAGIIVKASTRPGSAYAAMLVTAGHGVRLQWNYVNDAPGMAGSASAASPRWLRLVRSGDVITGYDSADGTHWTSVGTVRLAGLPGTAQAGVFATAPPPPQNHQAGQSSGGTGTFDHVTLTGAVGAGTWTGTSMDPGPIPTGPAGYRQTGGSAFTVTGTGDIAPDIGMGGTGVATPLSFTLIGVTAGLIAAIAVASGFASSEYRRGLIRISLAATPARGRVLAAKAVVAGGTSFAAALAGCAIVIPIAEHLLREHGNVIEPADFLTVVRVVAGISAMFAGAAVLGVAFGVMLRGGAAAVTTALAVTVLPWFLAASVLPAGIGDWLLRVFPSAAYAAEQTIPRYPQVAGSYEPFAGYYPLSALAGLAVLCAWVAVTLALAARQLRRLDA